MNYGNNALDNLLKKAGKGHDPESIQRQRLLCDEVLGKKIDWNSIERNAVDYKKLHERIEQKIDNAVNVVNNNGKAIRFQVQKLELSRREDHEESMRQRNRIAEENVKRMDAMDDKLNYLIENTPQKRQPSRRRSNFPTGASIITTDNVSIDQTVITESTMASSNARIELNKINDKLKQVTLEKKALKQDLCSVEAELKQKNDVIRAYKETHLQKKLKTKPREQPPSDITEESKARHAERIAKAHTITKQQRSALDDVIQNVTNPRRSSRLSERLSKK